MSFQYGIHYGAPLQAIDTIPAIFSASAVTSSASGGEYDGSLPTQTLLAAQIPKRVLYAPRTITRSNGSIPSIQVSVYDTSGRFIGGLDGYGIKQSEPLTGSQDIGEIIIHDGLHTKKLDMRQAQGWLQSIKRIGVTVGYSTNGKLIGSINNLDAVKNIYPDRDGVTFGTKCTYMIGSHGGNGRLYCA